MCECWTGASHQPSQGSSTPTQGPHTQITSTRRATPAPRAVTDAPVTPFNNPAWPHSLRLGDAIYDILRPAGFSDQFGIRIFLAGLNAQQQLEPEHSA